MVGEWQSVTLGNLADSISETHQLGKDRLIFLNTSDVLLGKVLHQSYSAVRNWPGQAKKSIRRNDILFSEIRPANGRWAYIDFDADDFVVSTKLMVIRSRVGRANPRFLYHFLTSPRTTRWLQHLAESRSGTFPQITFDQVAELELALPPLEVQIEIVRFLDSIVAKIELNRRTSETLGAIVRALFRSWFVDFDPVRATAKGRDPKLPLSLAGLFPNELEASELGEIPRGWGVGSILAKAQLLSGGTPKTDRQDYWDGKLPWASAKDVSQCADRFLITTERTITEKGLEESATQLIPAFSTVVVARGATTGRMVLFGRDMAMNQTCYALASRTKTPFTLYCQLFEGIGDLVHAAHGSVFDTITTSTFNTGRFILPADNALEEFEKLVSPMFERILKICEESRTLASLRDTILPKLISGELRVKDAEKRVEALV